MCVGRYAAKDMRNERSEMEHNRSEMPANIRITNTHPSGMRFRYQWAIWCCRIPLECIILVYLLQAFRKDSISLRSITSFLHTSHIKFLMEFHRIFFGTTCISFPNILSSGVFRRETASGFYPWGNVVSPPKRRRDCAVGGMETRFQ